MSDFNQVRALVSNLIDAATDVVTSSERHKLLFFKNHPSLYHRIKHLESVLDILCEKLDNDKQSD